MRARRYFFVAALLLSLASNVAAQLPVPNQLIITPHEARLEPGQGQRFEAMAFSPQGAPIRLEKISWAVLPDSAGKIGDDGFFIAARKDGEAQIIAKAVVGNVTYVGDAKVIIGKAPILPVRVVIEPGEAVVQPLGKQQFKAVVITPKAPPITNLRVKWDLIPNHLGKIDGDGLFAAAHGFGQAIVVAYVEFNGAIHRGEARVLVAPAPTAAIAGTVKDAKSNMPIKNAVVWAEHIGIFRWSQRTITDSLGNYLLGKLIPGLYVLRAESRGCLPEFYKEAPQFEQSTPVLLAENETKKSIDFSLSRGATISGSVAREDDKTPLPGAHVIAVLVLRPNVKHNAIADEKGKFSISALPAGTYAIFAEAGGYKGEFHQDKHDPVTAEHFSVRDEDNVTGVDIFLATASAIAGKVIDAATKAPVAKALVTIHTLITNNSLRPAIMFQIATNENGEYIANVKSGFYVVSAEGRGFHKEFFAEERDFKKAKPVQVFEDKHTIDINFTMDKLATISGNVKDQLSGKPLAGAIVTAFTEGRAADALIGKEELRKPFIAKTDSLGNYKIDGVPSGKYFVFAGKEGFLPEYWKEGAGLDKATIVEVPETGNVENLDFTLEQGGAIAGVVLNAADQKPIAGALVQVFGKNANAPVARLLAARDGKYRVNGLRSDEYIVFASAEGFAGLYYKDAQQRDQATPVKVEAPKETAGIDFQLKKGDARGGTITGVVTAETDKNPIPHAFVLLIALSNTPGQPGVPLFTMADQFGAYKMLVPAGKYIAVACAPRFLCEFFENAETFQKAKILALESGAVLANINFSLKPAQRGPYMITGRVRHQNQNRGAENVIVQAFDAETLIATAITGNDGSFMLEEMPVGEFKISATGAAGNATSPTPVSVGNGRNAGNIELTLITTSVNEPTVEVPTAYELEQNFPNPFNPETSIKYHLPARTSVTLRIYNALGQEVRTLVNQLQDAGVYSAKWDGKDKNGRQLTTGIYLFRLEAGDFTMTRKMAMVK